MIILSVNKVINYIIVFFFSEMKKHVFRVQLPRPVNLIEKVKFRFLTKTAFNASQQTMKSLMIQWCDRKIPFQPQTQQSVKTFVMFLL